MVKPKLLGGHYQLIKVIGYGELGETYLVADVTIAGYPKYVIKRLFTSKNHQRQNKCFGTLLEHNADIVSKISYHEQIAAHIAHFTDNHDFYLVREFVAGRSLAAEIAYAKRLSEIQVIALIKEILEIVNFLSRYQMIHFHLSPNNIIRRHSDKKLVLTDFDFIETAPTKFGLFAKELSQVNGTQEYTYSPQEWQQKQQRETSYIHSVAMIALQALTGLSQAKLLRFKDKFTLQENAELSPGLATIINKMLGVDSKDVYLSIDGVLADLEAWKEKDLLSRRSINYWSWQNRSYESYKLWFVLVGMILAIAFSICSPQIYSSLKYQWLWHQSLAQEKENDEQAVAEYTKVITLSPKSGKAYYRRGFAYYRLHNNPKALADFNQAIELGVSHAQIYWQRGDIRFKLGDTKGSLADYTTAIELDSDLAVAYAHRGLVEANLGNEKAAIADYTRAIELDNTNPETYANRCLAVSNQGDLESALLDCTKAINLKPDFALGYQYRGLVRRRLEDFQGAIEDYNRAIKLSPHHAKAYYDRGIARQIMGNLQGAIADYTEAIDRDPNYALAYHARGIAYGKQGNHQAAKTDLERAKQICLNQSKMSCSENVKY